VKRRPKRKQPKVRLAEPGDTPDRLLARLARYYVSKPCDCAACRDLRFLLGVPEP
jgi:hypothetical protein